MRIIRTAIFLSALFLALALPALAQTPTAKTTGQTAGSHMAWGLGINDRFGWQATVDLKYSGVLSDVSGIGTLGFERVNDTGNRWSPPILGGAYVKF